MEDLLDTERRVNSFKQFIVGRKILDFDCGAGNFLKNVEPIANSVFGIELQSSYKEALNRDGIPCFSTITELPIASRVETAFMFHVLEHLPDPLATLQDLHNRLDPDVGLLVVEVPNANDFLISKLQCGPFVKSTLWSQHLVLHTRDSLRKLLSAAGFVDVQIQGVQRYGLANHLTWLSQGISGGHKGALSILDTHALSEAYEAALAAHDLTDTLVALATVPRVR